MEIWENNNRKSKFIDRSYYEYSNTDLVRKYKLFFLSYNQRESEIIAASSLCTQLNCEYIKIKYASQSALCWNQCSLNPEFAGDKFLQTVGVKFQIYTASNAGGQSTEHHSS